METGKSINVLYAGKNITVFNQRSRQWTHLYDYRIPQKATLSSAGCGIFSICHVGQWLTGKRLQPEMLADFSMQNGGRGDDGTDRPALLAAMMAKGLAARFGFIYDGDGLRNDVELLQAFLLSHQGTALCNLRPGHIVALVDARRSEEETQALVIDSYSETLDTRVKPYVREVIPGSMIDCCICNERGVVTGEQRQYAMYWASMDTVRDFNLLYGMGKG